MRFLIFAALLVISACTHSKNEPLISVSFAPSKLSLDKAYFKQRILMLNELFHLNKPLHIIFNYSDEGALYDPETSQIIIPYKFVKDTRKLFSDAKQYTNAELLLVARGAIEFGIFHEIAHALVDQLSLPITSKEEDAADSLAIYLLMTFYSNSADLLLNAAMEFELNSRQSEQIDYEQIFSEHSIDLQRSYNIQCWVKAYLDEDIPLDNSEVVITEDSLEVCLEEGAKIASSWEHILKRHIKKPL